MGKRRGGGGDYEDQYGAVGAEGTAISAGNSEEGMEEEAGPRWRCGRRQAGIRCNIPTTAARAFSNSTATLLGTKQEVAQQREEFSQLTEKLKYGDEDDVASAAGEGAWDRMTPPRLITRRMLCRKLLVYLRRMKSKSDCRMKKRQRVIKAFCA